MGIGAFLELFWNLCNRAFSVPAKNVSFYKPTFVLGLTHYLFLPSGVHHEPLNH